MLFHFRLNDGVTKIPKSDCDRIAKTHSLPRIIDPEIQEAVTWTVGYSIPIDLLRRYCEVSTPKPHAVWRANFYKLANDTSHPHWLTWAPVDYPEPKFHVPESFGVLEFE